MGVRSYIKNTIKENSNMKGWASWDAIKENGRIVTGFVKDLKNPEDGTTPPFAATFEEAAAKLGLSEADIQKQAKKHLWVSIGCTILGLAALAWTILLLFKVMLLSGLVALSLSALMFAYAFQENFRYFQMKQRRLNCTVSEWFSNLFSSKKR